jgi:hypothetical protein
MSNGNGLGLACLVVIGIAAWSGGDSAPATSSAPDPVFAPQQLLPVETEEPFAPTSFDAEPAADFAPAHAGGPAFRVNQRSV